MDFKIAGDGEGLTAFQMDIKVEGITLPVMRTALESARVGLVHILGEMDKADPPPGGVMSKYAPQMRVVEVARKYIGKVIGKGGEQIKAICEETKVDTIDIDDEGQGDAVGELRVRHGSRGGDHRRTHRRARGWQDLPRCSVTKVLEFGAFVEVLPGWRACATSANSTSRARQQSKGCGHRGRQDRRQAPGDERARAAEAQPTRGAPGREREEARAQMAEAKAAAAARAEEGGGWGEDRGGDAKKRPPPKARRGRSRLRN